MDLQMLDGADLASSESFFRALAVWIADQLDLDVIPDQLWKPYLGPSVNFVRYLRREVLGQSVAPIAWGLDEVDHLHEMATHGLSIDALEAQADRDEGVFGDHLRRLLVSLVRAPELCDGVREVLQGRPCPTEEAFHRLRSAGVIAGEQARDVRPRCQLYVTYLERHLR
jgi:AAA-like domain